MKKMLLLAAPLSILLSSCVSNYMPMPPQKTDPASMKLAEAAASVSDSIETLEGIRKAEFPEYEKRLPNPATFGMNGYASIDWTGPIGPLVKRIAIASNYNYRTLGTAPAIPIIVSIHAQNQPLAQILRNADYQAGVRAYITVYPLQRTIELRYARS